MRHLAVAFLLSLSVVTALVAGCTQAQKDTFKRTMSGAPTSQPGGADGGIIGATENLQTESAILASTGVPYTSTFAAICGGLLLLERALLAMGVSLPNSKSSPSRSNSGSAGGTDTPAGQPSTSASLKAA